METLVIQNSPTFPDWPDLKNDILGMKSSGEMIRKEYTSHCIHFYTVLFSLYTMLNIHCLIYRVSHKNRPVFDRLYFVEKLFRVAHYGHQVTLKLNLHVIITKLFFVKIYNVYKLAKVFWCFSLSNVPPNKKLRKGIFISSKESSKHRTVFFLGHPVYSKYNEIITKTLLTKTWSWI